MLPIPYGLHAGIRETAYIGFFYNTVPFGSRGEENAFTLGVAGSSASGKGAAITLSPSTYYPPGSTVYSAVYLDWYTRWFATLFTQKVYAWVLIPEKNPDFPDYDHFSNSTSPDNFFPMNFNFTVERDVTLSNGYKYTYYCYTNLAPLLVSNNWFVLYPV